MNIDNILSCLNENCVDYILIGGVNFLLHHEPELTFDVDIWAANDEVNLERLNCALRALNAEWGPTEKAWAPVPTKLEWLKTQRIFCLTTASGALDVFFDVKGLDGKYAQCKAAALSGKTATGITYVGLSDQHMLESQLALNVADQKPKRIQILKQALARRRETGGSDSNIQ